MYNQKLIKEDLEWLLKQPLTPERDHIESCLKWLLVIPSEEDQPGSLQKWKDDRQGFAEMIKQLRALCMGCNIG